MDSSAGLLLYRRTPELEVFLGHFGGPYWQNKDEGAWTIPKGLIEDDALDELARLSSGVPRQLVILARQACLDALKEGRSVIDTAAVRAAANQQRNEYEVLLDRDQRELLRAVHDNKAINNDEPHRALLHNLSVLQYQNDDVWYDVHPIVLPLIEADEESAETDA